jgi:hypothetical protein
MYLIGKNNYLEIFNPKGYKGAQIGDVGLGFMTDKIGTIDSLYKHWRTNMDSVNLFTRKRIDEYTDTIPWFHFISIPNLDSVNIEPWLMENTKEEMISKGFTEEDLLKDIEYWDYAKASRARKLGLPPDSVVYNKLFDRILSLHLTLSAAEYNYIKQYFIGFGFTEHDGYFIKDNFEIHYTLTESKHYILNRIDFSLLDSVKTEEYSFKNFKFLVSGNKASMRIMY